MDYFGSKYAGLELGIYSRLAKLLDSSDLMFLDNDAYDDDSVKETKLNSDEESDAIIKYVKRTLQALGDMWKESQIALLVNELKINKIEKVMARVRNFRAKYIYEGYLETKLVLIGRNGDHTQSLIGELLGGRWFSFPNQEQISNGERFIGMRFKLVPFREFDYKNKQFGTIECDALSDWVSLHYRDMEQEVADYGKKSKEANGKLLAPSP